MTASLRPRPCGVAPRLPRIDPARCTGCGRCVAACPPHVLHLEPVRWEKVAELHDAGGCTGCSLCELRCPFGAIRMEAQTTTGSGSSRMPKRP
ncbi:MAG: 4Fe-4S binding protein [Rubrivivax sp.]